MKMIQKYLILGVLIFSLRIDVSADSQSGLVDRELTQQLYDAVQFDNSDNVEKLLKKMSEMPKDIKTELLDSLDSRGFALVHRAALDNNAEILDYLLTAGANPNIQVMRNKSSSETGRIDISPGATPLHFVAESLINQLHGDQVHMNKACFILLKQSGADLAAVNFNGYTLLHVLAMRYNKNWHEFMEAVINAGVDVNAITDLGQTALHLLVQSNQPDKLEIAKKLLKHGAYSQIKDQRGKTPFDYISSTSYDDQALRELLEVYKKSFGIHTKDNVTDNKKQNKNKELQFNNDVGVRYYDKNKRNDAWDYDNDVWDDVLPLAESGHKELTKTKKYPNKSLGYKETCKALALYDDDDLMDKFVDKFCVIS